MLEETTNPREWASTLRISKSHMQTYLICPRKFYFQYVAATPWEFVPVSLPFGSALHEAAAFYYRTLKRKETPEPGAVLEEFEAAWENQTAGRSIRYGKGASKASMAGLGKALLGKFLAEVRPRRIEAVEYPFSVPLHDPDSGAPMEYQLVGVMDLIESDDEGSLIIAELKTSAKRYGDEQAEGGLDGMVYAYALDQLGFRTREEQTLIRYDVLVKTKKPAFQQVYLNKEIRDFRRLVRWIREILRAIDREAFWPNYGWACKQCPFRTTCWNL